ncbi:MAG: hypothetical protein HY897_20340 [Deltaproteobacteria bacterium]|nr:hypothetical protein [Deltaproteobacteria bacterium]
MKSDDQWKNVAPGDDHTCGIQSDGTLWCWGSDLYSQLGDGEQYYGSFFAPIRVGNDSDWIMSSSGEQHSCAIKNNGTLWCWGRNYFGQVGNGTTQKQTAPVLIEVH